MTAKLRIRQNLILAYNIIRIAIPYRTTKFKSTSILVKAIWDQLPNLIPANISSYTVSLFSLLLCSLQQNIHTGMVQRTYIDTVIVIMSVNFYLATQGEKVTNKC